MTLELPEYVKHIAADEHHITALCGADIRVHFAFVDVNHAFNNARQQGRLLICHTCSCVVMSALKLGTNWTQQ